MKTALVALTGSFGLGKVAGEIRLKHISENGLCMFSSGSVCSPDGSLSPGSVLETAEKTLQMDS
jgi:hypothetical protein